MARAAPPPEAWMLPVCLLLAGCFGAAVHEVPTEVVEGRFGSLRPVSQDVAGAEPVVAVGPEGHLYVQAIGGSSEGPANSLWRSRDDGRTWDQIAPPGEARDDPRDGFVAVSRTGTVYLANAEDYRLRIYRSEGGNAPWLKLHPSVEDPIHRMWLVPEGDRTVHLAVDRVPWNRGIVYARSDDAGVTWTEPVLIDNSSIHGSNLALDPVRDGLHVARVRNDVAVLHSSDDGGETWTQGARITGVGKHAPPWTTLVADDHGNLYYVWSGGFGLLSEGTRVHFVTSGDGGRTWSDPKAIAGSDGTQTLPWADARGNGTLGIVWLESEADGRPGEVDAAWRARYALVEEAHTATPRAIVTLVSPRAVHEGPICLEGPGCESKQERRLHDFSWTAFDGEGRAHVAVTTTTTDVGPYPFAAHAVATLDA